MNTTGHTIAKNASVLMVSQVMTWGMSLLLTIFLPRYLGVAAIGKFHLANSIWAIVAIFVSFGMNIMLTKEIARAPTPTRAAELLGTSFVLRVLLFVLGFGAVAFYLQVAGYPPVTVQVTYVIGLSTLIWVLAGATQAALQGLERMEYISLAGIMGKLFVTVASIALLLMGYGLLPIAVVSIGGALITLLIQVLNLNRLLKIRFRFERKLVTWMLRASVPYLLSGVFLVIYSQIDVVIISLLVNEETVGWYGAADRLFGTLLFIPSVFMTAVFPALSRMFTNEPDAMPRLMRKSFDLLLILSLPIGLGVLVIAEPLVVLLYGAEFANSGPVLALFGIVLIFTYQNMLLGQFLISTDRQNIWTVVMAVAMLATIPLDLVLVPWCESTFGNGAMGGALAFIITELGMTVAGLSLLAEGSLGRSNIRLAARATLAALVMTGTVWWLRDWFIAVPIVVGAIVYGSLLLLLQVLPKEDLMLILNLGQNLLNRLRHTRTNPAGAGG